MLLDLGVAEDCRRGVRKFKVPDSSAPSSMNSMYDSLLKRECGEKEYYGVRRVLTKFSQHHGGIDEISVPSSFV